jgi:hypothetical protein
MTGLLCIRANFAGEIDYDDCPERHVLGPAIDRNRSSPCAVISVEIEESAQVSRFDFDQM